MNHAFAKAFVAIMTLWTFMFQRSLYGTRNERTSITVIQAIFALYKGYTLLHGIVLMCYAVMESLSDGVVIVLLHGVREECASWQFTHSEVAHLGQYLIDRQDKWDGEMFVVNDYMVFIFQCPCYLCYCRMEFL